MISEKVFRLKKNGEPYYDCYCRDITKIENYAKAVLDTTQIWDCHHRRETHYLKNGKWIRREQDLTAEQLIAEGAYYDVPSSELIFLIHAEHRSLHQKGNEYSEETKRKLSESLTNREDLSKKVLCVETNEVFESTRDASRKTGVNQSNISQVCNGNRKTAGGYHWKYYEPINNV